MKIFSVVLNWNNAQDTLNCVSSLLEAEREPDKIVVVDNGSTDDSVYLLKLKLPQKCHLIQAGDNLGYAGGLLVGANWCLESGAELIWFLNNDTWVLEDTLANLAEAFLRNGKDFLYSPKVLYSSDPSKVYFEGISFSYRTGRFSSLSSQQNNSFIENLDYFSDAIHGCSFVVHSDIIRKFGFMDPEYFLYWEEYEYCFRLSKHGIQCLCVPSSIMFHKVEGSQHVDSAGLKNIRTYYRTRNKILFWKEYVNVLFYLKFLMIFIFFEIVKMYRSRSYDKYVTLGLLHGFLGKKGRIFYLN